MNSVDTGWIADEDPLHITLIKEIEHGFHPPLDHVDAAARICAPIFDGFLTGPISGASSSRTTNRRAGRSPTPPSHTNAVSTFTLRTWRLSNAAFRLQDTGRIFFLKNGELIVFCLVYQR